MKNVNFKYLEVIRLNFDNGTKGKFKFLQLVELNEETYIVLLPDGGNGTIVHIYKLENLKSKATLRYLPVQDKEIENKVLEIYNKGEHNYQKKQSKSETPEISNISAGLTILIIVAVIVSIIFVFYECKATKTSKNHLEEAHSRMLTPAWNYMTDNSTDVTFQYRQYGDGCIETKISAFDRLRCDPMEVISWYMAK